MTAGSIRERWKPVVGWEPYYEVSSLGRVRSIERTIKAPGLPSGWRTVKQCVLQPGTDLNGYRHVRLCVGGIGKTTKVAGIVARAFLKMEKGQHVDHINGNRQDDRVMNLRPATQSENARNTRRRQDNVCGWKGVHRAPTKKIGWKAQIMLDGVVTYLGVYNTPEDAHRAYVRAGRKAFGRFFNCGCGLIGKGPDRGSGDCRLNP